LVESGHKASGGVVFACSASVGTSERVGEGEHFFDVVNVVFEEGTLDHSTRRVSNTVECCVDEALYLRGVARRWHDSDVTEGRRVSWRGDGDWCLIFLGANDDMSLIGEAERDQHFLSMDVVSDGEF
jgi:hypothetical protein